jgi:fibronectin type 3 domain-containing protein
MTLTVGPDAVSVVWEAPEQQDIVSFRLYRYERGKTPVIIATVPQGTTLFTDTTAQRGKLYFYYLTSVHSNGIESSTGKEEGIWR